MNIAKVQQYLFFVLLAGISFFFLWIIKPFVMPIFWAIVLTIVFHPFYTRLLSLTRSRHALSSVITILGVLIIVFLPLSLFGNVLFNEVQEVYQNIAGQDIDSKKVDIIQSLSSLTRFLEPYGIDQQEIIGRAQDALESAGTFLTAQIVSISKNIVGFLFDVVIMLYILFFLLKDGDKMLTKIKDMLPLGKSREDMLFDRFAIITRTSVKGELLIAVTQGIIGGMLFLFAGVSAPALWGLTMALFAFLPGVGTGIVTIPAGIILILSGQVASGITILAGGMIFVGLVDNFLRPYLVSKGTQIPDMLVLLSTLGGLFLFGLSGVIIGPLVTGFFITMWDIFGDTYKDKLQES